MNSFEYIFSKQVNWAQNQGIDLVGSKGARGRPAYTKMFTGNLFKLLASLTGLKNCALVQAPAGNGELIKIQ